MIKTIFTQPLGSGDSVEVSCRSLEYELLEVTEPNLLQDVIRDFVIYVCGSTDLVETQVFETVPE